MARSRGQILHGGACDPSRRKIAPTLVAVADGDDPLMQEELFGPLLPVLSVANLEEALAQVRSRPKPLALYLFSRSEAARQQVLAGTSSGSVCFNDVVMQAGATALPFGGVGESGLGRYHGKGRLRHLLPPAQCAEPPLLARSARALPALRRQARAGETAAGLIQLGLGGWTRRSEPLP